jgi:hypothetical protein
MRSLVALYLAVLSALAVLSIAAPGNAHGMRTGALRIQETAPGHALVTWRTTVAVPGVSPVFPPACRASDTGSIEGGLARAFTLACDGGLSGQVVGVRGLGGPVGMGDATAFVAFADGRTASHVLTAASPTWELPAQTTGVRTLVEHVRLGVVHIATGADHLLFLLALVVLVRAPRRVFLAELAFTLSHCGAFSAAALGWVHAPALVAEACIAWSLVLVALDLARAPSAAHPARTLPADALLAFVFGLVHGLGFAGGLRELGLPDGHVASALLGFGAGIEIGQVAFVVVVLLTLALAERARLARFIRPVTSYAVGSIGAFWLLDRTLRCFVH